jgi:GntR family transcriptional regulator
MLSYSHNCKAEISPMLLHLDYHSSEPICQQAVAQIKLLVVKGKLKPDDKLPSVRQLARELKINPTTVCRIYNELAHEGVVTQRQGQGVFVAPGDSRLARAEVRRSLAKHAQTLLVEGLRQGVPLEEIQTILAEEHRRIEEQKP